MTVGQEWIFLCQISLVQLQHGLVLRVFKEEIVFKKPCDQEQYYLVFSYGLLALQSLQNISEI